MFGEEIFEALRPGAMRRDAAGAIEQDAERGERALFADTPDPMRVMLGIRQRGLDAEDAVPESSVGFGFLLVNSTCQRQFKAA